MNNELVAFISAVICFLITLYFIYITMALYRMVGGVE